MALTKKEIEYFSDQLPEGSKVVVNYSDLTSNLFMIACLLEGVNSLPIKLRDLGQRLEFAVKISEEFTELHSATDWCHINWDEELEVFVSNKIKELEV